MTHDLREFDDAVATVKVEDNPLAEADCRRVWMLLREVARDLTAYCPDNEKRAEAVEHLMRAGEAACEAICPPKESEPEGSDEGSEEKSSEEQQVASKDESATMEE